MHNGALGTIQYYAGGVLTDLCFDSDLPGDQHDRLQIVWEEVQLEYISQGTKNKLTQLTLQMFYNGANFSILTGKATETIALIFVSPD